MAGGHCLGAVLATLRAELQRRWRRWLGLAVVFGIGAGLVLGAATGARRTDSAYPRLLEASHPYDYALANVPGDPSIPQLPLERIATLPQVVETSAFNFYGTPFQAGQPIAAADDRFGVTFNTFYVVHGRMYKPHAPDEAVISEFTAQKNHIHVGQVVTIPFGSPQFGEQPVLVKIVGTIVAAQAFPPRPAGRGDPFFLSPGFTAAHPKLFHLREVLYRLRHGASDVDAFKREIAAMTGGLPFSFNIEARVQDRNTERAIHVQAVAMWLLAGLIGIAMLAALGQSFSRQIFLEAEEHPALRSIGMSKVQLWGLGMSRALVIGLAGSLIAMIVGMGVSWFTPIGIARLAEIHKGFVADWVVLSVGFVGALLVSGLLAAWPAWRNASDAVRDHEFEKPSRAADAAARAGLSPSTVSGIRLALEPGRGRTAVPVRSTVLGVAIGIAAVVASLGFAANLSHLLRTPVQYGWNWDRLVTTENENLSPDETRAVLGARGVDATDRGTTGVDVTIDGKATTAIIMEPPQGNRGIVPVLSGRNPIRSGEILLGQRTMRLLGKRIGDSVHVVAFGGNPSGETFQVVGMGVLPVVSDAGGLGTGAVFTLSNAPLLVNFGEGASAAPDTLLIHFTHDTDQAAVVSSLKARFPDLDFESESLPADLADFGGVRNLPFIMAALLAALALLLLIHTLTSSIRRRSRDLAILKTMGFASNQLRATVAWQASTLTIVALIVGIPLGTIGARYAWNLFAANLGVVPDTISPVIAIASLIPIALVIANMIAALPGAAARRIEPAVVLRTE
jgi:ABC-type antimicrobial peptide transport system permease subunit